MLGTEPGGADHQRRLRFARRLEVGGERLGSGEVDQHVAAVRQRQRIAADDEAGAELAADDRVAGALDRAAELQPRRLGQRGDDRLPHTPARAQHAYPRHPPLPSTFAGAYTGFVAEIERRGILGACDVRFRPIADIVRCFIPQHDRRMKMLRFLMGSQHAPIMLPLTLLFSVGLLLAAAGVVSRETIYGSSIWIGVGYLISLVLSLFDRRH